MNYSFRRALSLAGLLAVVTPMASPAQDFFREYGSSRSSAGFGPIMPSDYTYTDASPTGLAPLISPQEEASVDENDKYNFALGPFRFALAAGFGVEINDNIFLADEDVGRDSDIILRPSLNIDAIYRISELNTLRFSLGASYAKYLDHSEFDTDGVLLSPTSELEFRVEIGDVRVTVRDRFSYQEDPYDIPVISGVTRYKRFENQIGAQFDWDLNANLRLTGGYDHYNLWELDDFFGQTRSVDTLFFKPSYLLTPALRLGVNASFSFVNFESAGREDGYSLLAGPFLELEISESTNLYLEAGYQQLSFDGSSNFDSEYIDRIIDELDTTDVNQEFARDSFSDNDNSTSYYVKLELNNRPSEAFEHRISASKTAEIGFLSNYYDLYHVEYSANWKLLPKTTLSPAVFYEYYETSGSFNEQAHRVGVAVGVRHNLTNTVTVGLDYRFLFKDSDLPSADYYQNLAFLSVYYKF